MNQSVELNLNWFWIECEGCDAIWRSDELKFVSSDVGLDTVRCPSCEEKIGTVDERGLFRQNALTNG